MEKLKRFYVYKMNVEDVAATANKDYKAEYGEEYNPTESGDCHFDRNISMWRLNDDWYVGIYIYEDDIRTLKDYLEDAYNTIGVSRHSCPEQVFSNLDIY